MQSAVFRSCSVSRTLRPGSPQSPRSVRQRIDYKLAILTIKIRRSSTPAYLARHIKSRQIPRIHVVSSSFLRHAFTAQTYYQNSLLTVLSVVLLLQSGIRLATTLSNVSSTSLAVFKSTVKTFLFRQTFRP